MYTKDKSIRVTLRLNQDQFDFVKLNSDIIGVSPSEFLRIVINSTMSATKSCVTELQKEKGQAEGRENDKASIDDLV